MEKYIIGIDIGGTNTDAVLVDKNANILAGMKIPTEVQVENSFEQIVRGIIAKAQIDKEQIFSIMLGTTHAMNALLQIKDLYKVGLIRIAGHNPNTLPACFGWSEELINSIFAGEITVSGGYECDGREISPFSIKEVEDAIKTLRENGAQSIAVAGVFSSIFPQQEIEVGEIIESMLGKEFPYTLSHKIASLGIIERENSAIINSALIKSLTLGFSKLTKILESLDIKAPLYITKNNGTVITLSEALKFPVLTIAAGPMNSFIGASKLAGLDNAIIIDIGGTSSDCGIVINGFPRRSLNISSIANIKLNLAMPDLISIALGGGSIIAKDDNDDYNIGPASVANQLFKKAKSFGGDELTVTDIAIRAGIVNNFKPTHQVEITDNEISIIMGKFADKLDQLYSIMSTTIKQEVPLVLVGGGAALIDVKLLKSNAILPDNFPIANAYGAALSEISATYDKIINIDDRLAKLAEIERELFADLLKRGGDIESARIIEQLIIPFNYMPGNLARVVITAACKINV